MSTPPTPDKLPAATGGKTGLRPLSRRAASLICPGLGQALEGRYAMAMLQFFTFVAGCALALGPLLLTLWRTLTALLADEPQTVAFAGVPWISVTVGMTIAVATVVWSIADAGRTAR